MVLRDGRDYGRWMMVACLPTLRQYELSWGLCMMQEHDMYTIRDSVA